MKKILIFGAGRSATILIRYLLNQAKIHKWEVLVADYDYETVVQKINGHPNGKALKLDINKRRLRNELIEQSDIVVSLLPVSLHYLVVKDCIKHKKHLITASYLSNEMYALEEEIREAAILMVGEMGLDPGIDHMSAMQKIDELRACGCEITSFKSYTGGLIAPECNDNPWQYKFTWNPRNVVLAGQGTAQYLIQGRYKYIPYNRIFRSTETIPVKGLGDLEAYANRDSLLYRKIYKLDNIPTLVRGTLRYPGYSRSWDAFVKLGWTDDSYPIIGSADMTYRRFLEAYLSGVYKSYPKNYTLQDRLAEFLRIDRHDETMKKLEWLGIFEDTRVGLEEASPAMILQDLLLKKWSLEDTDRDMVVMKHQFGYIKDGKPKQLHSTMILKGENQLETAMAKLVGLPIGIFVKLIMLGKIKATGVHIPVIPEIYDPVLTELEEHGVSFVEEEMDDD
jgi:saccharopine dehydrogenase-like NADP-dependent oxidoreductase